MFLKPVRGTFPRTGCRRPWIFGNDYNFGFCSRFSSGIVSRVATDDDDGAEERVGKDKEKEFETDC